MRNLGLINKELSIPKALFPVIILVGLLTYKIFIFGYSALGGRNQFLLIIGAVVAAVVNFLNNVSYLQMVEEAGHNIKKIILKC